MTRPYTKRSPFWSKYGANEERAKLMASMYRNGLTLQQVGDKYQITRERVRQILERQGLTRDEGGQAITSAQNQRERLAKRDARYQRRFGMTYQEYRAIPQKVKTAFREHKHNSQFRGIEFRFTLGEWYSLWLRSGKFANRGRKRGNYVMCRKNDVGPYSAENVYIATCAENIRDYHLHKSSTEEAAA